MKIETLSNEVARRIKSKDESFKTAVVVVCGRHGLDPQKYMSPIGSNLGSRPRKREDRPHKPLFTPEEMEEMIEEAEQLALERQDHLVSDL